MQKATTPSPQPVNQEGGGSVIAATGLVKSFPSESGGFLALNHVDLRVNRGEFVAIVGKSGSGKSTLINLISGIDRPTHGEVVVAGTAINTLGEGQLAAWRGLSVGIVFQFFQLLPTLTVLENVILPMDFTKRYPARERRERAMEMLRLVAIPEQGDKLPSSLSGGQQQRAAIARALVNDPPVLVADEPTGNLDTRTAEDMLELFGELTASGKSLVVATHEKDIERHADRVVVLADGKIIEETNGRRANARGQERMVQHG